MNMIQFIRIKRNKGTLAILLGCTILMIGGISCKKLVETPPPTDLVSEASVFSTDATAIAVLNGIYISMNQNGLGQPVQGINSISLLAGLSADELALYSGVTDLKYKSYYTNALASPVTGTAAGSEHWEALYNYVFKCNAAISGLNLSTTLAPSIKTQLLGESKLLRAFFYFYLVNLFGDLPLVLSTDPKINTILFRSSKEKVYDQIIQDLTDAENELSTNYLNSTLLNTTTERVRPTKWAAKAMLARVYLYTKQFDKCEAKASELIENNSSFSLQSNLNEVFLKNSQETIWQIQPTEANLNTMEGQTLVLSAPANGPNSSSQPVYLNTSLLNSFEAGDLRAIPKNWIDTITVSGITYFFPFKYKINTSPGVTSAASFGEYFMMLRLAEQYLIRAEARAEQANLAGAIDDVDKIRNRAGLQLISNTNSGISKDELIDVLIHERRVELFSEWGNRWFDLKRTGRIDQVMEIETPLKSNDIQQWQSYQQLYPLPYLELKRAPNLVQNPGY